MRVLHAVIPIFATLLQVNRPITQHIVQPTTTKAAVTDSSAPKPQRLQVAPAPQASADTRAQEETKIVLGRWQLWGALAAVVFPCAGGVVTALISARKEKKEQVKVADARPGVMVGSGASLLLLAVFVFYVLPSFISAPSVPPDTVKIQQMAASAAAQKMSDEINQVDRIQERLRGIETKLDQYSRDSDALTRAVHANRERIPSESYLLSGYDDLRRDTRQLDEVVTTLRTRFDTRENASLVTTMTAAISFASLMLSLATFYFMFARLARK